MTKYVDSNNLTYYNNKIKKVIKDGDSMNESITVELGQNGSLGGYKTGDTIAKDTTLQTVIKKLLAKQIPPTYSTPTVTLQNNNGSAFGNYEIGSIITPKVKATYNQNDGGSLKSIAFLKNSIEQSSQNISPATYEEDAQTLSSTISFKAKISYNEGDIKNDNLGEPYPIGRIPAGTNTSVTYSFIPYRQGYFWGILNTSSLEAPLTSEIIRAGTKKNGAYAAGSITGVAASSVSNRKRIFIACPADKKGVTKVIMPSAMNADCTADFIKQSETILVEGANGYDAIAYNVWVYEPAAISDDQTFTVTLG